MYSYIIAAAVTIGALCGSFQIGRNYEANAIANVSLKAANDELVRELKNVADAGKLITIQATALSNTAKTNQRLSDEFKANSKSVSDLNQCLVSASLHALSIERTKAIAASAK